MRTVRVGEPAGVVLAAGLGTRLRPLTLLRPKALCPVDGQPLLDGALRRCAEQTGWGVDVLAVNAHHLAGQVQEHVGTRARVSVEQPRALGTAGAVARLRPWLDGRPVLLTNADSYLSGPLADLRLLTAGWDGMRCRLLVVPTTAGGRADFPAQAGPAPSLPGSAHRLTGWSYVGACLLPWSAVRHLAEEPSGLYEVLWAGELAAGRLELVAGGGVAVDCGTPADYLRANLHASGGGNVVGRDAVVHGRLTRSVVWDGAVVRPDEHLVDTIRAGDAENPVTVRAMAGR